MNGLGRGRDAARTLSALAEMNGCSRREIEASIQAARLDGTPVLSGSEGVWLAVTPAEAREWVQRQRSRAIHLMESAQGVERWADSQDARQETLWGKAA